MAPLELISFVTNQVVTTLLHNWPFLAVGIATAAVLRVYIGTERLAALLRRRTAVSVAGSVTVAVATPFCSCGTTAVVLSMLGATVPWAPIVAFMVASPLTSPDELVLSAGLFGWPFALLFFVGSIVLGLAGGLVAHVAEKAGLLGGQARFEAPAAETGDPCAMGCPSAPAMIGPGAASVAEFAPIDRWRLRAFGRELAAVAARMIPLFVGFAAIGYAVVALVPTAWITTLLGGDSPVSVVVAASLGVPFYISTEASLPLVASLMAGGMGTGPAMAFLVTGAGTSVAAVSGALLIARWRVLAIVVGVLWVGAIVLGLLAGAIFP
jgi:uncharacterized membrane protein YraQ (UPF0718 family)